MNPSPAHAILVYRLGSLGDTVLALPSFHLVRKSFPVARITLLTNISVHSKAPSILSILQPAGLADEAIAYPLGSRSPVALWELTKTIRARRFAAAVYLAEARGVVASVRDYIFLRACGIRRVHGLTWRWRDMVAAPSALAGLGEWEAGKLVRRVSSLGHADLTAAESWNLRLTADEECRADDLLRGASVKGPFLAVSLGTKVESKDWGEENWSRLLRRLSGHFPSLTLVAVGAAEESQRTTKCLKNWSGPVANLCGTASPRASAAILRRACLFLGHDSGPMHLAGASGTPVVALFSWHSAPGCWLPPGRNCTLIYPRLPARGWHVGMRNLLAPGQSIQRLGVEVVADQVIHHLNGGTGCGLMYV
jgi:ADP-heptose:LPS heptosyltransferase